MITKTQLSIAILTGTLIGVPFGIVYPLLTKGDSMPIIPVSKYRTSDGQEFGSRGEAEKHETEWNLRRFFQRCGCTEAQIASIMASERELRNIITQDDES